MDKDAKKKSSGRGEAKLITKCPEQRREGDDHRSGWDKKAEKQLCQARRCDHMAYRLQILDQVESQDKADKYQELNEQAIRKISNNIHEDMLNRRT